MNGTFYYENTDSRIKASVQYYDTIKSAKQAAPDDHWKKWFGKDLISYCPSGMLNGDRDRRTFERI